MWKKKKPGLKFKPRLFYSRAYFLTMGNILPFANRPELWKLIEKISVGIKQKIQQKVD